MENLLLVCLAAFVAAGVNAFAGGGTFVLFPTLTGVAKMTEKAANIASTIGIWPGTASSVAAVWQEISRLPRGIVLSYTILCLIGGAVGAELLLHTSETAFHYVIPWLLLFATTVFAMSTRVQKWAKREAAATAGHSTSWVIFFGALQFVLSVYGGYFGAGMSVLTLAGLSLVGLGDIRVINTLKVLLAAATNLTAAIIFLFGPVPWHYVGPMAFCSAIGGFVGMHAAKRVPQRVLRGAILTIAISLTTAYFWKVYG